MYFKDAYNMYFLGCETGKYGDDCRSCMECHSCG